MIDGHAAIQMLGTPPSLGKTSFRDMAERFLSHVLQRSTSTSPEVNQQVHVVFDKYLEDSIKAQTRGKRGEGQGHLYQVRADVAIPPNWKQFLTHGANKRNLAEYYTEYMMEHAPALLQDHQTIYTSGGKEDTTLCITHEDVHTVDSLRSSQEEADTRIVLHSVAAAEAGADTIVVRSPDTDVLVLLLHHRAVIKAKEVFFLTGREGKHTQLRRYIPIHSIYELLSTSQHRILLPVYCLTGCDTVSSFHGHGKRTAFRVMMQKAEHFQPLAMLGSEESVPEDVEVCAMKFVGAMYGKASCTSLNALRCEKAGKKNLQGKKLPPTEDSFHLHLLRCAYQLSIWRQADVSMAVLPAPTVCGYERRTDGSGLQPQMMAQPPAPPELLNDLVCDCVPDACAVECSCLDSGQPCTSACSCGAMLDGEDGHLCANPLTISAVDTPDSDSDAE